MIEYDKLLSLTRPNLYNALSRGGQPIEYIHKFGYSKDISSSTLDLVFPDTAANTLVDVQATAQTTTISSTSANDVATSGTGAWTVEIHGLTTGFVKATETVSLNGQSAVTCANTYISVWRAEVKTWGTGKTNAGDIWVGFGTVTTGVPASKFAKIETGDNQTCQLLYTIPANKTGYFLGFDLSSGKGRELEIRIEYKYESVANAGWIVKHVFFNYEQILVHLPNLPLILPEKTTVRVTAKSDVGTNSIGGSFDLLVVDDAA